MLCVSAAVCARAARLRQRKWHPVSITVAVWVTVGRAASVTVSMVPAPRSSIGRALDCINRAGRAGAPGAPTFEALPSPQTRIRRPDTGSTAASMLWRTSQSARPPPLPPTRAAAHHTAAAPRARRRLVPFQAARVAIRVVAPSRASPPPPARERARPSPAPPAGWPLEGSEQPAPPIRPSRPRCRCVCVCARARVFM